MNIERVRIWGPWLQGEGLVGDEGEELVRGEGAGGEPDHGLLLPLLLLGGDLVEDVRYSGPGGGGCGALGGLTRHRARARTSAWLRAHRGELRSDGKSSRFGS